MSRTHISMKAALLGAASLVAAVALPAAAGAAPVIFTFTGTMSAAGTAGISVGDTITLKLTADNGGSSLLNQTWDYSDLQGFTIQVGSYSASYSQVWPYPSSGNFVTDGSGTLITTDFYGTGDSSSNTDNFGSNVGDIVYGNGTFYDTLGNGNAVAGSSWANPRMWTVSVAESAVPEPASWALLIVGFFAAGTALRRRTATISFA